MSDQLQLFDLAVDPPANPHRAALAAAHAQAREIAAGLPAEVRFGTSSWSFPGWAGIVYSAERNTTELARTGLREYAQHPLLRTVGIDRSFYAPIPVDELRAYAAQLPAGFRCCIKAPGAVTAFALGAPGAQPERNADFLSVERLVSDLLEPLSIAFMPYVGPIILEFSPFPSGLRLEPAAFVDRLDRFLGALPREFEYAVELRDARLLTEDYRRVLGAHGVAHTFNYWSAMPSLAHQARAIAPEEQPFSVVRLLLKPGMWYRERRDAFSPFNRIVEPDERMRAEVTEVARRALRRQKRVYILVNNKAEGSSPLTVVEVAKRLVRERV